MGGKQLGFSDFKLTTAKKQTKREKFLSEMEVVVPSGLIQSLAQASLQGLSARVEVGGIASSLCSKATLLQPIST